MFLEDIEVFRGVKERNDKGETLEEFLENYDPKKYDMPSHTVDMIVLRCREKLESFDQKLQILLIQRKNHPCIGMWGTPGGFVDLREDLIDAAKRELEEETGVKGLPMQQLLTYGKYDLDPRWRVITTPFLSLVEGDIPVKAGDDALDAAWFDVSIEKNEDIYHLEMKKEDWNIWADVREIKESHSLLPQIRYELVRSYHMDECHCCIITQALAYLKEQLDK